jgi:hypothetical protein
MVRQPAAAVHQQISPSTSPVGLRRAISSPNPLPGKYRTLEPVMSISLSLEMLAETEAYHSLEENLKNMRFAENERGEKQSWRWKAKTDKG